MLRLYHAVGALSAEAYRRPRGLFFGDIHGTLNHLLVVDRLWNGRMEGLDHGTLRLSDELCPDLASLREAREAEDGRLIRIVEALDGDALVAPLTYRVIIGSGTETVRRDHCLLGQLNHQTYHRGQVVAALNQDGIEPPPLDVVFYLEELGLTRGADVPAAPPR
jgi:uncharacterized damage-inducible protein DinB